MRDHSKHIQVNKDEAVRLIVENCSFDPKIETVPASEACGRVLAADAWSKWDSPNCLTCRMDSVAVHFDDFAGGMPDTSNWVRGKDWEFANTGVAMPAGFDTAIVVEHVLFSENDTKVAFDSMPSKRYAGTSAPGSKLRAGDILVKKGTLITALLLATIVSGNNTEVRVVKRPKVGFIPTGNELVTASDAGIKIGKNIESNSYMIAQKIREWGGEAIVYDIVPDDKEALKEALLKGAGECDIVVLNAGSSKGNDDWGIEMLEELGTIFYHQTNHGPGHHSSFGILNNTPVIGISGPPGGAAFTTDYYLYPAMMAYYGREPQLKKVKARLGADIPEAGKFLKKNPENMGVNAESRPAEDGEFYSVKQMKLKVSEDGILEAFAAGSSHPGPEEAENADAYFLMNSSFGAQPPKKGDLIEVELRPDFMK